MGSTSGKVLDYRTRTKSCRFVMVPQPWENNPKRMTADKIMRPRQKQWSLLPQLSCLTELQTNVLSFHFTQAMSTPQQSDTYGRKEEVEKQKVTLYIWKTLSTHLYSLSQNGKFDNCSPLSQKVINYLMKLFIYPSAPNKGYSKGILAAIKSIFRVGYRLVQLVSRK